MPNIVVETLSFEPDKPIHIGGLKECSGFVPTANGMKTAPVPQSVGKTLSGTCRGIDSFQAFQYGTNTIVAGTEDKLFLDQGAGLVDFSDAGGYSLTNISSHDWYFAAFNERIYAASLSETLQSTDGVADFAAVSGAPKARIIEPFGLFLMAFNIDASGWTYGDGWWNSQEATGETWTVGTNQADRGRLYATPGPIVAAKAIGDLMCAYKENGAYTGVYSGNPFKPFNWTLVSGAQGAVGPKAIANIYPNGVAAQFVVGPKSMYVFDGNRQSIVGSNEIQKWFYADLADQYQSETEVLVDHRNNLVYILYVSQATSDNAILDGCIVWNYSVNRWGVGRDYDARNVFQYPDYAAGLTAFKPAIVNSSNVLQTLDADPTSANTSYLTTRAYGDENKITHVNRLRMRELTNPSSTFTTADVSHYSADNLAFQSQVTDTAAVTNNRADFRRSARWHKDKIAVAGKGEFDAVSVTVTQESDE